MTFKKTKKNEWEIQRDHHHNELRLNVDERELFEAKKGTYTHTPSSGAMAWHGFPRLCHINNKTSGEEGEVDVHSSSDQYSRETDAVEHSTGLGHKPNFVLT